MAQGNQNPHGKATGLLNKDVDTQSPPCARPTNPKPAVPLPAAVPPAPCQPSSSEKRERLQPVTLSPRSGAEMRFCCLSSLTSVFAGCLSWDVTADRPPSAPGPCSAFPKLGELRAQPGRGDSQNRERGAPCSFFGLEGLGKGNLQLSGPSASLGTLLHCQAHVSEEQIRASSLPSNAGLTLRTHVRPRAASSCLEPATNLPGEPGWLHPPGTDTQMPLPRTRHAASCNPKESTPRPRQPRASRSPASSSRGADRTPSTTDEGI